MGRQSQTGELDKKLSHWELSQLLDCSPNVGLLLTSGSESEQALMAERLLYLQVHGWVGKSQRYPRKAVLEPNTDRIGRKISDTVFLFLRQWERAWRNPVYSTNFSRNA